MVLADIGIKPARESRDHDIFNLFACSSLNQVEGCSWHAFRITVRDECTDKRSQQLGEQIIVKTYTGREAEATKKFQAESPMMAAQGYSPVFQSWTPGQWQTRSLIAVLLLCLLIVGIPALLYMLIVTPDGALTVTYVGSRADPAPEGALRSKLAH